jgi:hypothetical protein
VSTRPGMRSWPLLLIASPAAVAVWSGWVGLGELSGFGLIHPLPGIAQGFQLNTAITLPVGVEAYASFALGAWLRPGTPDRAKTFARRSAIGALCLGMLGQVAYHVLAAAHAHRAPWPVVILVACLPVVTLGFGVALAHLLRADDEPGLSADRAVGMSDSIAPTAVQTGSQTAPETGTEALSQTGPVAISEPVRKALPASGTDRSARGGTNRSGKRKSDRSAGRAGIVDADREFAAEIAAGEVPSLYQIRSRLHVGNERAKVLRQHIARQALTT